MHYCIYKILMNQENINDAMQENVNDVNTNLNENGRSQDLNQHLQNIVQNLDDDVIIMTLTSLL